MQQAAARFRPSNVRLRASNSQERRREVPQRMPNQAFSCSLHMGDVQVTFTTAALGYAVAARTRWIDQRHSFTLTLKGLFILVAMSSHKQRVDVGIHSYRLVQERPPGAKGERLPNSMITRSHGPYNFMRLAPLWGSSQRRKTRLSVVLREWYRVVQVCRLMLLAAVVKSLHDNVLA